MQSIKYTKGMTSEPSPDDYSADQEYFESQGFTGLSLPRLLSDRPEGLHSSSPLIEKIIIDNG